MYKCTKCNGTDVEEQMWVNLNTFEISDNPTTDCDLDNTSMHWCNDCEENVVIYSDD